MENAYRKLFERANATGLRIGLRRTRFGSNKGRNVIVVKRGSRWKFARTITATEASDLREPLDTTAERVHAQLDYIERQEHGGAAA